MVATIQRSFSAGEVSPSLHSRADLAKYATGVAECTNFIVLAQGGAASRPGLRYIGPLFDHTKRGRLIPFSFNTEQTYILVFEDLQVSIVMDGAFVVDSTNPPNLYTLVTPYTEAQLDRLIFTQDADVMTITHPDHAPRTLSRLDHDDWQLDLVNFAATVTPPGALTLVAYGGTSTSDNMTYAYVVTAVDENGVESLPSPSNTITTPALNTTCGVKITWVAIPDTVYYRVYKDPSDGSGLYGWIGDTVTTQFVDFNVAPVTSDAPPSDYLPFASNNNPATVGDYQQRQIYANTVNEPQTVFASQTAVYDSMRSSDPPRDSDSLEFTIKAKQVNEIRHIVSLNSLILMTSSAEWVISEGVNQVLSPSTIGGRPFSFFGSSWTPPVVAGDSVIFVQEKGSRVRDLFNQVNPEDAGGGVKFGGTDLTIMARHLFGEDESGTPQYTIDETAYSQEPYGIYWAVRSDGTLLGMTYLREHSVWAWHKHVTGEADVFESVASINEDGRDAVYVIVRRTIGASTVRYVERFETRDTTSATDAFCVDSGLTYDGVAADVISGLDHLEGMDVAVLADGNEVTDLTVTAGAITLPNEASVVHVGLPYTPALQTLDLDVDSAETVNNKEKSISKVQLNVLRSRGGHVAWVNDLDETSDFMEIPPRQESDGYDAIALKTFKTDVVLPAGWSRAGALRIEQRSPLPLTILAVVPETDVSV